MYYFPPTMTSTMEQELHVFTVGADREWRTVRIHGAGHGVLYGDPACDDGAVYWYSEDESYYKNVRFDLSTEKITSKLRRLIDSKMSCWYSPVTFNPCFIGIRWFGELLEDGDWSINIDKVVHETYSVTHPTGWSLPGTHALKRGHLLLRREKQGDLRACAIAERSASSLDIGHLWDSKPLIETGSMEEVPVENYKFVRVPSGSNGSSEVEVPVIGRLPSKQQAI